MIFSQFAICKVKWSLIFFYFSLITGAGGPFHAALYVLAPVPVPVAAVFCFLQEPFLPFDF
jgi:hypothetical protein